LSRNGGGAIELFLGTEGSVFACCLRGERVAFRPIGSPSSLASAGLKTIVS